MPSSKFSSWPPAHKRPPVCHKAPPPSDPPLPPTPPTQLTTLAIQVDADPLAPSKQAAYFQSTWDATLRRYFGRSSEKPTRLEVTLTPAAAPNYWNARLDVWDPVRLPETFLYFDIFVNPSHFFDTGRFGDVIISGKDFRRLRMNV